MSMSGKTVLAISLGANLLLAGVLAGGFLLRPHHPPMPPFGGPPGMMQDDKTLSPAVRELFRILGKQHEESRASFDSARLALISAIEAPVFDGDAYDRAEDQMRSAHDAGKRKIATVIRTALATMPLADRKAFAAHLRRMPPPPPPPENRTPSGMPPQLPPR